MFDDNVFEHWLDEKSKEIVSKLGNKESLNSEEMIILVLKAQTNHFHHLDSDLRQDMNLLRQDVQRDITELRSDMLKRFEQVDQRFEQVDKRFEQVDKRFEQVDKRFEQVDKRFDRSYAFMKWQTGIGVALASSILLKLILM